MDPLAASSPSKKKGPDPDAQTCAHCLAVQSRGGVAELFACARCGLVAYCSKDCQRAHWKAGHKSFCIAKVDRAPPPPALPSSKEMINQNAAEDEECVICLDPLALASAATLPCGHVFHPACVEGLRSFGMKQVCPLCRTELPPGPERSFDKATRLFFTLQTRVKKGVSSWGALTKVEQRQMEVVIENWTAAANLGLAEAQFTLGFRYSKGQGMAQSDAEAVKWIKKAADQGYAKAQNSLGFKYEKGIGVTQSSVQAIKWFHKAAEQGQANAQANLSNAYDKGEGVNQNLSEANKWRRKAAEQGHTQAQFNLGDMHAHGRGVPQSDLKAVQWYRKAAIQGYAKAQFVLGERFAKGEGVPQSDLKAVQWYRKAAEQGDASAQFKLAVMYDGGLGVPQSDTEAMSWYRKAADQGLSDAQFSLASIYEIGQGVPQSYQKAAQWYQEAADQGNVQARDALETLEQRSGAVSTLTGCAHCGLSAPNQRSCRRCKAVTYCSKECQVTHWKAGHRSMCGA